MSVPLSSTKLRLPSGFNALIHGFCYEILKSQPEDIHAFGALYFANLLDAREGKQIEEEDATQKYHDSQKDFSRQLLQTEEEDLPVSTEGDEMSAKEATKDGRTSGDGGMVVDAKNLHADGSDAGIGVVGASGEADNSALVSGKETNAEQEVIDIDLEDPDVKKAASLIQSGFKGRMMRKKMAAESTNLPIQVEKQTKLKPVEDYVNIETHSKADHDDREEKLRKQDKAATKIQAGVRGMAVRRNLKPMKREQLLAEDEMKDQSSVKKSDDDDDDDDGDEGSVHNDVMTAELRKNEAATKIQSGIKGMQVRKRMKQKVQLEDAFNDSLLEKSAGDDDDDDDEEEEAIDDDYDDENNNEGYDDDDNDKTWQKNRAVDKIQAGYLGMKTRRKMREIKMERDEDNKEGGRNGEDGDEEEDGGGGKQTELEMNELLNKSATKIQAGVRGMKARKEINDRRMYLTQRSYSLSQAHLTDPQDEIDKAAAKIQAGVRGMKARRELKKQQSEGGNKPRGSVSQTFNNVDDQDIDELNNAASKIQAGMRGMKVRRDFKRRMSEGGKDVPLRNERDKAATKIQAGVKGMKVRKDLKSRRQMTFDDSWRDIEPVEEEDTVQYGEQAVDKELAATRIQDGVRGMQVRKNMSRRRSMGANALSDASEPIVEGTFGNLDRDEAATKIQAGVRGMKTRQELKKRHLVEQNVGKPWQYGQSSVDLDRAATKIQAGVRGMRTRKDLGIQKAPWKTFDADDLGSADID